VPTTSPAAILARLPGVGDDHVFAGCGGDAGGLELAGHAPFAQPGDRVANQAEHRGVEPGDRVNQRREFIVRVAVVQTVDVREQHQQRGADEVGHHGGQAVVVAKGGHQLVDAHRVVFVDDRHGPELEQRADGVADVEIAGAVVQVVGRQQQLGGVPAVGPQAAVVGLDQMALPDGSHGLQLGQVGRPPGQVKLAQARANSPGSDQGHLAAGGHQLVQFFSQRRHAFLIQQARGTREHPGADFDDHGVGRGGNFLTQQVGHRKAFGEAVG